MLHTNCLLFVAVYEISVSINALTIAINETFHIYILWKGTEIEQLFYYYEQLELIIKISS